MALVQRDARLAADLEAARRSDEWNSMLLVGSIILVGGLTFAADVLHSLAGAMPAIGRLAVALLGLLGGTLPLMHPQARLADRPGAFYGFLGIHAVVDTPLD